VIRVSGRHDGRSILLPVAVLRPDNPSDLTHGIYTGLLDTGATSSWISPRIISDLRLSEFSKNRVSFAMDQQIVSIYLFRLGLFADGTEGSTVPFVFAETQGFQMRQRDGFDVILGMNVLAQGDFKMMRSAEWSLEFS
jgi:predicted aspartyl protease